MSPRFALLPFALCAVCSLPAAEINAGATHYDRPAIEIGNDRIAVTVMPLGGPIVKVISRQDPAEINPLWDSFRNDQESGRPIRQNGGVGHFTCVDGFGPTSPEERAAGLEGHGEAHRHIWSTASSRAGNGVAELTQVVSLPIVYETLQRTITLRDGENVLKVHSELTSLLGFDRPAVWAEHATIGSPFLEPGKTVVDMSANKALTRPHPKGAPGRQHRLPGGVEFEWPMAPTADGGKVDLRAAPVHPDSGDHTGHLMTKSGKVAWVTALHPEKKLLLGYLFKTDEYPWLQTWESYPAQGMLARGLEFGTQAFDLPRRQVVTENSLFGQLLYRWLPALSTITTDYLMFWTPAPEGMLGVDEIEMTGGAIVLHDKRGGKTLKLKTQQTLK
ncbi:MAG: hypothetical protein GC160_20865 [Acidobacteria bacterium]|nr:hypothetical protein [Acidobacteriota bacterium]